jgi:hypothetical protein
MATQDWPTDRAFMGATFTLGADVPKSVFRGFYTGNRETLSHLGDRLNCIVTLPPCKSKADAARREAFCMGLVSTGDWVRFGMPHRAAPVGALGGAPTVNGAVLAGARSLALAAAKAAPNQLLSGSFEVDTNADGRSDNWSAYSAGSTGSVGYALSGGTLGTNFTHGAVAQRVNASALASGAGNRAGVVQSTLFPAAAFSSASAAVDVKATAGVTVVLEVDFFDGTPTLVAAPNVSATPGVSGFTRLKLEGIAVPATAVRADFYVWMASGTGAAALMDIDAAQLEFNAAASAFAGFAAATPGDFIGIGGNLLQVAYPGATANDAGAMTVPLVYPAPKAITSGAAVTLSAPTGTWELDTDGLQLDYTAGVIQQGIALPFRQVPV